MNSTVHQADINFTLRLKTRRNTCHCFSLPLKSRKPACEANVSTSSHQLSLVSSLFLFYARKHWNSSHPKPFSWAKFQHPKSLSTSQQSGNPHAWNHMISSKITLSTSIIPMHPFHVFLRTSFRYTGTEPRRTNPRANWVCYDEAVRQQRDYSRKKARNTKGWGGQARLQKLAKLITG